MSGLLNAGADIAAPPHSPGARPGDDGTAALAEAVLPHALLHPRNIDDVTEVGRVPLLAETR